jgi:hypothetical protein
LRRGGRRLSSRAEDGASEAPRAPRSRSGELPRRDASIAPARPAASQSPSRSFRSATGAAMRHRTLRAGGVFSDRSRARFSVAFESAAAVANRAQSRGLPQGAAALCRLGASIQLERLPVTAPTSVLSALAAALLFGASTSCAKALLAEGPPILLARLLYLGSGIGLQHEHAFEWDGREPHARAPS